MPTRHLLGQVFTPDAVADLIAGLCIHRPDATVFDPCVGEGALLLAAGRRLCALGARDWRRQVFGWELEPSTWQRGRERLAAAAGVDTGQLQIGRGDFLALDAELREEPRLPLCGGPGGQSAEGTAPGTGRQSRLYDVAVMNPPYTRQEALPAAWKESVRGAGGRAGLHVHFWMRLAGFVREGGWLGAITSATWLSAGFGQALQAFLLQHFRVHLLIAFDRDVFPDAQVEACVAILEKRSGCAEASTRDGASVRFIHLRAGTAPAEAVADALARQASGEGRGYRLRIVPQASLASEHRWGRFFFPPACGEPVASAAGSVPLAALAHIRRGVTTGNNRVFLLKPEAVRRFAIEERYLRAMVRSPREIPGLDTLEVAQPARLLLAPGPEGAGSGAAAYLQEQGVAGSRYLGGALPPPVPLLFGYAVRARKRFFRNGAGLLAGDSFFCITLQREEDLRVLFALLNAAPTALLLEMQGRGQGRGLLKIQRYELADLRVPDPVRLDSGLRRELETLGEALRRAPAEEPAQAALDHLAARALGLDGKELRCSERALAAERQARALRGGGAMDQRRQR